MVRAIDKELERHGRKTKRRVQSVFTDWVSGKVTAVAGNGQRRAFDSWEELKDVLTPAEMEGFLTIHEDEVDEDMSRAMLALGVQEAKRAETRTKKDSEKK